ncbi:hypothetical protein LSH36_140g05001 [Paralvinella palmiformis]|uniref:Transposase n=1 Tax=Paralvinella palmiformis TaxID=53620 RepID=A0AAD9JVJ1_9ANNE|nr:hypothetical protein LSH36_140g05001 [Paralvinella palmiformis]
MLACTRFHGSHTADAIAKQFATTSATFDLTNKVSRIVKNNATNKLKAFSQPGFEAVDDASQSTSEDSCNDDDDGVATTASDDALFDYVNEHVSCFAHTLQLVIKDCLKQAAAINKVLATASAIVSHVRKSIHATDMLEDHTRLQTANATRWNSQMAMAFESAIHCVQGGRVVTGEFIPQAVAVGHGLIVNSAQKRLRKYEEHDAFQTASVLDLRFKLNWCNESESQILRAAIIAKATSVSGVFPDSGLQSTDEQSPPKSVVAFSFP